MGRLAILLLVIVTIIVLWKAFGPKTWNKQGLDQKKQFPQLGRQKNKEVTAKGPDDDPDFLWNIKKERFKAQREAERREQEAVERARRDQRHTGRQSPTGDAPDEDTRHGNRDSRKGQQAQPSAEEPRSPRPGDSQNKGTNKGPGSGGGGQQEKKDGEGSA